MSGCGSGGHAYVAPVSLFRIKRLFIANRNSRIAVRWLWPRERGTPRGRGQAQQVPAFTAAPYRYSKIGLPVNGFSGLSTRDLVGSFSQKALFFSAMNDSKPAWLLAAAHPPSEFSEPG